MGSALFSTLYSELAVIEILFIEFIPKDIYLEQHEKSKKIHIIVALILYIPFIMVFIAEILWILCEKGILKNESLYSFLFNINQAVDPYLLSDWVQWLFGILILAVILTIISAEFSLHRRILISAKNAAEKQKEKISEIQHQLMSLQLSPLIQQARGM